MGRGRSTLSEHDQVDAGGADVPARVGRVRRVFRSLRRHPRVVGGVLLVAASFAGGTLVGWEAHARSEQETAATLVVNVDRPVTAAESATLASVAAPNLLGLDFESARQALVDAGVDPQQISRRDVPSAGASGVVVVQVPVAGVPVTGPVELGLSVAAQVPEVVGATIDAARDRFDELGAQVRVIRRYDPAASEGTVLAVDPPVGSPLPTAVDVTVASAPSSVFLTALRAAEGRCGTGEASINGTSFPTALTCSPSGQTAESVWLIDRRVVRMDVTVGQDDTGEPGAAVAWAIIGDGRVLLEGTVGYGQSVPVAVDLRGVLRLELRYSVTDQPDDVGRARLVFGAADACRRA